MKQKRLDILASQRGNVRREEQMSGSTAIDVRGGDVAKGVNMTGKNDSNDGLFMAIAMELTLCFLFFGLCWYCISPSRSTKVKEMSGRTQ
jgi:hypothetical protein